MPRLKSGRRLPIGGNTALYSLVGRDDADRVTVPDVPAPVEGTTYGMRNHGIFPS